MAYTPRRETFRKVSRKHQLRRASLETLACSTASIGCGELFLLNRLMRRDMMEMQRNMVLHAQQAYRDIEQLKANIHGLLSLQSAVLEHAEKRQSAPPAPPPDCVGLGHSALAMLKEVGVALIQRGSPRSGTPSAPQLPAASVAPASEPPPAADVSKPPDALERHRQTAPVAQRAGTGPGDELSHGVGRASAELPGASACARGPGAWRRAAVCHGSGRMIMENYYLTLGVDPQASADQIKSAYRRCKSSRPRSAARWPRK
jgi:hypothetical protein